MKKTTLVLQDEVNCRFLDLDPETRRKVVQSLEFMPGYARHTPAFKMGRWDGKISFATVGGGTYINLLDRVLPVVAAAGYDISLDDRRVPFPVQFEEVEEDYLSYAVWPVGHRLEGEPIMLLDHQVRAINTYLIEKQCMMSISTSAGKTIITAALAKKVEDTIPGGRTLTIVPNKSLVGQTEDDFKLVGLDVGVFFGDRKEWGHQHIVATWQSLSVFAKKNRQKRIEIDRGFLDLLSGVVAVVVDEAHSAKGIELRNLLSDTNGGANIPLRWGMTGSVPDEDFEFFAILGVIGPVMGEITAKELQDKEILSSCHIHVKQTDESNLKFKDYHEAHSFLVRDELRMSWLAGYCEKLQKTGNVLILYEKIDTGDILKSFIDGLVIVNGGTSLKKRKAAYDNFNDDTRICCAATYGVAAVGINIPSLHHIVLIEAGKSVVRVIQSVGRGLRRTKIKLHVDIHDICSTNQFSNKHLKERIKRYEKVQYPWDIEKIKY
jgi:superfamily II DNA or RNA helicase